MFIFYSFFVLAVGFHSCKTKMIDVKLFQYNKTQDLISFGLNFVRVSKVLYCFVYKISF